MHLRYFYIGGWKTRSWERSSIKMARTTSLVVVPLTTSTAWYFSCTCFFCLFLLFPFWQKYGVYHIFSTEDKNTHVHRVRASCCRWESFRPWRLFCRTEGNQSEHCMLHLDTMRRWVLQKKSNFNQKVDVLACSQVSGHAGAGHVAADLERMLQQREERLDFLLDEGMFVMQVS